MQTCFGLVHIKKAGAPIHPDDVDCDMREEQYNRQLAAYNDYFAQEDITE